MPSKRKSTRTAQLAPQPTQSDYDTDAAALTDTAIMAAIPPPPVRTDTELNLLVLRRWYPSIQYIEAIAPFAAIYTFAPETESWKELDVQGTLFMCRMQDPHTAQSSVRIIVLNRKNPENWHYDIVTDEGVQLEGDYIIIQDTDDVEKPIYGIWVFSDGGAEVNSRQLIYDKIVENGMQARLLAEDHAHDFDVSDQYQAYEEYESPQSQEQPGLEKRIDINSLFAKPPLAQVQPQTTAAPPTSQQSTLLNLFKST